MCRRLGRWAGARSVAAAAPPFSTTALRLRWRCCSCSAAQYGTATVAGVDDSTARFAARHSIQYAVDGTAGDGRVRMVYKRPHFAEMPQ